MNFRLIVTIFFVLISVLTEVYVYFGLKPMITTSKWATLYWGIYCLFLVGSITSVFFFVKQFYSTPQLGIKNAWDNVMIGLTITLILTKIGLIIGLFVDDLFRGIKWTTAKFSGTDMSTFDNSRRKFMIQIGLVLAGLNFSAFFYGIIKGKYNYQVKKIVLKSPDLPPEFNGYRIAQISDVHSGSFDSIEDVQRGLNLLQDENPDLILFTGDLVNNYADEIVPFISMFDKLHAPDGKFSITGNHDYGVYVPWKSKEEKEQNFTQFMQHHQSMGFRLMMDESVHINKNGKSIRLAGVQNWGIPPMPQFGDLNKALNGIEADEFTVLMSHDPSHWDKMIKQHPKKIHLTLSGHTHGMQMGVDIPGLKWSPVKYKYPKWAGLYEEEDQSLYVNKGFGFLGFPGRVGMWPEITIIELQST